MFRSERSNRPHRSRRHRPALRTRRSTPQDSNRRCSDTRNPRSRCPGRKASHWGGSRNPCTLRNPESMTDSSRPHRIRHFHNRSGTPHQNTPHRRNIHNQTGRWNSFPPHCRSHPRNIRDTHSRPDPYSSNPRKGCNTSHPPHRHTIQFPRMHSPGTRAHCNTCLHTNHRNQPAQRIGRSIPPCSIRDRQSRHMP